VGVEGSNAFSRFLIDAIRAWGLSFERVGCVIADQATYD
jgi:hypothetical protein